MSTTFHKTSNNAAGTLSVGIDDDDLSIVLQTGEGAEFPADAECPFYATIFTDDVEAGEIVIVTGVSSDTFTITRAAQSTVAKAWDADANVQLLVTAGQFDELQTGINDIETGVTSHDKILVAAGAVGAPAIQMGGDTTTGWYRSAANEIAGAISGVVRFILSATGLAITGAVTATGAITSSGGSVVSNNTAGNATIVANNTGNGNYSAFLLRRERASGVDTYGGVMRIQSNTSNDNTEMTLGVNTNLGSSGLGAISAGFVITSASSIVTAIGTLLVHGVSGSVRGQLRLYHGAGSNTPGTICLYSKGGTPYYFWVTDAGVLRVHNALPTADTDGSAV